MPVRIDFHGRDLAKPACRHVQADGCLNEVVQSNGALEKGADRRLHRRTECDWQAVVCLESGEVFDAVAVDASQGGMRLVSEKFVSKGDRIIVELIDIGRFSCDVRWVGKGQFGVQFLEAAEEISHSVVDGLADYILPEQG